MKFKNILRILSGSKSCETIIFSGCFFYFWFFMTFNYLYFLTPFSLIFCKSILRFYFDYLFMFLKSVRFGIDDNYNNLLPYPYFLQC